MTDTAPLDDPTTLPVPEPLSAATADLRDLLSRVASGDLDPDEAARLLDADPAAPTLDRREIPVDLAPAASVVIRSGGVKLVVIADPSVATAVVDGPHSIRHEGPTMIVEAPGGEGYQMQDKPKFLGWVPGVWTGGRGERVTVRINPDLPLTVEPIASSVEISGVHAELRLKSEASSVKVRDHRGSLQGSATMSSVNVRGVISGPSTLLCEFGSLHLRLDPGSDVAVAAVAEMGSLKLGGGDVTQEDGGMRMRGSLGAGSQSLDLTVRMGSATVVAA